MRLLRGRDCHYLPCIASSCHALFQDLKEAETVFKGDVKNVEEDPVAQMERCPIPIIGAISGHAITAGFEIALACDILVADTTAKFLDTHAKYLAGQFCFFLTKLSYSQSFHAGLEFFPLGDCLKSSHV